ncbi:hypothetical protein N9153_01955 [Planctomicrobium sp.]|nr:hypothetical protein [bacterium]MDB4439667.1 hypothetical protein [Planctomicrobium sp.]
MPEQTELSYELCYGVFDAKHCFVLRVGGNNTIVEKLQDKKTE